MKWHTFVEIDVPYCTLDYGVAPCTAALGVTGEIKCFNTRKTCQDIENFSDDPVTLRFAKSTDYLPTDVHVLPFLDDISFSPGTLSLGKDLGQRASLTITLKDRHWGEAFPAGDKYVGERTYQPNQLGTFFGKFRARQPFLRGKQLRLIRGYLGQSLAEMETRHYIIESFDGPKPDGSYEITAKDVLKLADGDRAQAPRLSDGRLGADITAVATQATLSPATVGNAEYPASGYVSIGGREICAFTRSGDTLTLTRAQFETEAQSHDAGDRVQLCLHYDAVSPATILADLLQNYADVDPSFIPTTEWEARVATYLGNVYTALIAEPVSVLTLINEIIEQAGLIVWWDDINQQIPLDVLRNILPSALRFSQDNYRPGSLEISEQPETRLSEIQVYFGLRNPLLPLDEQENYRSVESSRDDTAATDYGTPAIKKIYSRWIPFGGRSIASKIGLIQLSRFRDPPRRFNFKVPREGVGIVPQVGIGYRLEGWALQDATGAAEDAAVLITRVIPGPEDYAVEAEEVLFTGYDPSESLNRVITIDANANNLNLRTLHDTIYAAPTEDDISAGVNLTVIVDTGVVVGSLSAGTTGRALTIGDWPTSGGTPFPVTVEVRGGIRGKHGANGAPGSSGLGGNRTAVPPSGQMNGFPGGPGGAGQQGGTAIYTRHPFKLKFSDGDIWAGGGGSGGGGGGGGGGSAWVNSFPQAFSNGGNGGPGGTGNAVPGSPGSPGSLGSGSGGPGGASGAFNGYGLSGNNGSPGGSGQPGVTNQHGTGGAGGPGGAAGAGAPAGYAIDGWSYVTVEGAAGDLRGPTVN